MTMYNDTPLQSEISRKVHEAAAFARERHDEQKYGKYPYMYHLNDVYMLAVQYNLSETVRICAWLHDGPEDGKMFLDEIWLRFGDRVTEVTWRVTDEPGRNRKERKAKTYPKIALDEEAVQVKLLDRIANVRQSMGNAKLGGMYVKEHLEFVKGLHNESMHLSTALLWDWYFKSMKYLRRSLEPVSVPKPNDLQ
jgi:(p)ppGpp synthase/HD superfamily hydrolase